MGTTVVGVGVAIILIVFALLAVFGTWASRYHKVGPDEVLVVSGRRRTVKHPDGRTEDLGYRVVRNGGTFVWPVLEKVGHLSLHVMSTEVTTKNAMSKEGVPLEVTGTALFKVSGNEDGTANAAERYLGRPSEDMSAT